MLRIYRKFMVGTMCAVFLTSPLASDGAELKGDTLQTWDAYVETANLKMRDRAHTTFLWVDESPDRIHRVRDGEILVDSIGDRNPKPVPSGLIHDWIGAAFIPHAKLEDVLSAARDYDHYKNFYQPTVADSKALGSEGTCDKYSMRVVNKEAAETVLDGNYQACYLQLDAKRWYSIAYTTSLQEVRGYGRPDERDLPPGQGNGYVWRLYTFTRFEERDDGVYVELEAMALSRDIPGAVRWAVTPIVRRISKNSMLTSLRQMEEAVRSTAAIENGIKPSTVAASGHCTRDRFGDQVTSCL